MNNLECSWPHIIPLIGRIKDWKTCTLQGTVRERVRENESILRGELEREIISLELVFHILAFKRMCG